MKGLGYRQRAILTVLEEQGRPTPLGFIVRTFADDCPSSYHNTANSLLSLRRLGLVRRVRQGWWEAA